MWDGVGRGEDTAKDHALQNEPGTDTEKCKAQLAAAFPGPVHWEGRSSPESLLSFWFQLLIPIPFQEGNQVK